MAIADIFRHLWSGRSRVRIHLSGVASDTPQCWSDRADDGQCCLLHLPSVRQRDLPDSDKRTGSGSLRDCGWICNLPFAHSCLSGKTIGPSSQYLDIRVRVKY